jgi:hypothetical protein
VFASSVLLPNGSRSRMVHSSAPRWSRFAHHLDRPRAFAEARRELARFPDSDDFGEELSAAGFEAVELNRVAVPRRFDREQALAKIRGRHISSFDLLADEEYRSGLARAERELSAEGVEYTLRSLFVVAVRPAR